jgi:predicted ABC-type transport system involved in lysophospholipase L1 biosynthesis ATPase subunit
MFSMSFRGRFRGLLMSELLAMRGVCKGSSDGRRPVQVLTDLSLEIGRGEIVAVVGSHGMGKTMLLEIAAGIKLPDEGGVWLGDLKLASLSSRERERLLGYEIAWTDRKEPRLPWTARDYVALPLALGRRHGRREARNLAERTLERVGIGGCAERRWGELSVWEQVLVGFARGIAGRPRWMVADDLLDGLARRQTQEAGDLLRDLVEELGCGVLMSAADLETALVADRVWLFERGGRLRLMSDQSRGEATIIDFPNGGSQGRSSRSVGS